LLISPGFQRGALLVPLVDAARRVERQPQQHRAEYQDARRRPRPKPSRPPRTRPPTER
jgi:hypothetical protein